MKNFKRIAALLLALCMVFALCACGGNDGGKDKDKDKDEDKVEKKTDAEIIVGSWATTLDMTSLLEELDGGDELAQLLMYFDFSSVDLVLTANFDEKGNYELAFTVDENQMKLMFRNGMEKMLDDMLVGSGYTIDDIAAAEGMTKDAYLDAMVDESLELDDIFEDSNESGTYKIEDGKIYLIEKDADADDSQYAVYELTEDELTFKEFYNDGVKNESSAYPMVFERA